MSTGWATILAVAAVVALGWAVRTFVRTRRDGGVQVSARSPGAAPARSDGPAGEPPPDAGPGPGGQGGGPDAAAALEPERSILERLCARAYADVQAGPVAGSDAAPSPAAAVAIDTLSRIRAHPRYVPRRPHLLPQLTRAINDPSASAQSIAAILRQDPALAGNLLRIANSAMYRRRDAPIEQLERAVALLGTEGLRRTAMAALMQPVISDDGSGLARCAAALWEHTLLAANIASQPTAGANRDELHAAQLLVLLCGLGSVVVVQVARDSWARAGEGTPPLDTLVSLLDAWSLRCARAISTDWGLSARVQRTLDDLADGDDGEARGDLARSLRIARALAAAQLPGGPAVEPAGL